MGWTWVLPFQTNFMRAKYMWMSSVDTVQPNQIDRTKKHAFHSVARTEWNLQWARYAIRSGWAKVSWICLHRYCCCKWTNKEYGRSIYIWTELFIIFCLPLSPGHSLLLICIYEHLCQRGKKRKRYWAWDLEREEERIRKKHNWMRHFIPFLL